MLLCDRGVMDQRAGVFITQTTAGETLTGNAEESELEEARRLGVAGIVEKPSILKKVGEVLTRLT